TSASSGSRSATSKPATTTMPSAGTTPCTWCRRPNARTPAPRSPAPAAESSVGQRAQPLLQRLQLLLVTAPAVDVAGVHRFGPLVVAVGRRCTAVPGDVADAVLLRQVAERQHFGHHRFRVL